MQIKTYFNNKKKGKTSHIIASLAIILLYASALTSCQEGETYADMKEKEKVAIDRFIESNPYTKGHIQVISEDQFEAQNYQTDTLNNQFVLFNKTGVYMQIIRAGIGESMIEMAKKDADSTITKEILCRFLEYDIESGYETIENFKQNSPKVEKMQCTYTHRGRSYSASFTQGQMMSNYGSPVPAGWLKPLDYIRLTRQTDNVAKVRIIVPHSSGTSNASGYVLPMYYEITYQLGI